MPCRLGKTRMRLLLFNLVTDIDDPILGFATRWIEALAQRVEFIHVITMRAGRIETPANVQVCSVGKEKRYSEPRRAVEFYQHLWRVLREDRIDVCFSHMIPIFTILAAPILQPAGIPLVTWYAHPSLTWMLKLAHHLSDRMVTSIATAYPYRHDKKLTVVGQGIDTDLFSPHPTASLQGPRTILCVGRLSRVKDHSTLLRAAWLLHERWGKPFRVVVLGGCAGPQDKLYVRSLHDQVKQLGLEDTVHFEPAVPMTSLPYWYRRSTAHVNLTPTGFGDKVALEAMACGCPCLAANEGFQEIMGKSADRLLFKYGDAEDLAGRLEWILTLPQKERDQLGLFLREQVVHLHSLQGLVGKLIGVFSEVSMGRKNDRGQSHKSL
jgi:glycosyltransferase involved in cell wall biosynthesis